MKRVIAFVLVCLAAYYGVQAKAAVGAAVKLKPQIEARMSTLNSL